jgi:hypothetical protein
LIVLSADGSSSPDRPDSRLPAGRPTSRIENVPTTGSIKELTRAIAKINKMESSESIRVVFRGCVLSESDTLQDLADEIPAELRLPVTGIDPPALNDSDLLFHPLIRLIFIVSGMLLIPFLLDC